MPTPKSPPKSPSKSPSKSKPSVKSEPSAKKSASKSPTGKVATGGGGKRGEAAGKKPAATKNTSVPRSRKASPTAGRSAAPGKRKRAGGLAIGAAAAAEAAAAMMAVGLPDAPLGSEAGPPAPEPPSERVVAVVKLLDEKKAINPVLLDLSPVADFTHWFVIASGNSRTQVQAMADGVIRLFKKPGDHGFHIEGSADAAWLLIDLGEVVVHLFQPESRRHYDLEGLWADAPQVPLPLA